MSFKPLFARALGAAPDRLHLAAHSHHLWPDASFAGQVACWEDAARLADSKWDKVMGEVWPAAQAEVAAELGHRRSSFRRIPTISSCASPPPVRAGPAGRCAC